MLNMQTGRHRDAVDDFSQAIQHDENNVKHYQNRMNAYRTLGLKSSAVADGQRIVWLLKLRRINAIVAQKPQQLDGYILRASHLADAGRHKVALANYEQAIKVAANSASPWVGRADYWLKQGDFTKAIVDATKAIETEFDHAAFSIRGDVYLQLGQFDKAIADYKAAKRLDPAVAEAYYRRAIQRRQQGDEAGFRSDLDTARQLDPAIGQTSPQN